MLSWMILEQNISVAERYWESVEYIQISESFELIIYFDGNEHAVYRYSKYSVYIYIDNK
jgi:hypothetical protein